MELIKYPLLFEPILKERIWGGTKLKTDLDKNIFSDKTGESWELSAVKGDVSVVKNGPYKGKTLTKIIEHFKDELLGEKVFADFGTEFPLLFKFLDAKEDLSIQVHPNDELAKKRHNSFGKTEMWYVMQADADAKIIVGFKETSSPEQYLKHLKNNSLLEILNEVKVKKGDVFFLETGTIHAIGAGIVIAEIQQTSDITYRIYDWDRVDDKGNKRELHIDLALEAMDYEVKQTKKEYSKHENKSNIIVNSPYFTTCFTPVNGDLDVNKTGDTFTVYICTEGNFTFVYDKEQYSFKKGDTILVPASLKNYKLKGEAALLEIFIS